MERVDDDEPTGPQDITNIEQDPQQQRVQQLVELNVDFLFSAAHGNLLVLGGISSYPVGMAQTTKKLDWGKRNVVGTIHEARGWAAARRVKLDIYEVRVDVLDAPPDPGRVGALPGPALVTVRDVREGGARELPVAVRRDLYFEYLPVAAAVDIEARNLAAMSDVVEGARRARVPVVASFHDFEGVPSRRVVERVCRQAEEAGAACVKVAAKVSGAREMAALLDLFDRLPRPAAAMGMGGAAGMASRLALAAVGSSLNYGWLGRPQVPGQWPAASMVKLMGAMDT
jgi:3-dehydroquinate dehydratase I